MHSIKNFANFFNHLMEYQNQLLPDNKLAKDYIIIYDYIMDLLEKDVEIAKVLVRKKQEISKINADILLDLTKIFEVRSYIHEPFLCLTLEGCNNNCFVNIQHPFCNKKLSIVSQKVTKCIWLSLNEGLLRNGSFVRGYQGDIYELSLSLERYSNDYICINAFNEDVNLNINLRILLKYLRNPSNEKPRFKPYPRNDLNKEWFAVVSRSCCSKFDICLPKLETEMRQLYFKLVMVLRLMRFLFKKYKQLNHLNEGFLESVIYSEYMDRIRGMKNDNLRYQHILKGVLIHIYNALKSKQCPHFWNKQINLIKGFENTGLVANTFNTISIIFQQFQFLEDSNNLTYETFFEYFDFKMEPFSYEIDHFGIFKSY